MVLQVKRQQTRNLFTETLVKLIKARREAALLQSRHGATALEVTNPYSLNVYCIQWEISFHTLGLKF